MVGVSRDAAGSNPPPGPAFVMPAMEIVSVMPAVTAVVEITGASFEPVTVSTAVVGVAALCSSTTL